jgi:hypothetical protein
MASAEPKGYAVHTSTKRSGLHLNGYLVWAKNLTLHTLQPLSFHFSQERIAQKLIDSFEDYAFAGLSREQYDTSGSTTPIRRKKSRTALRPPRESTLISGTKSQHYPSWLAREFKPGKEYLEPDRRMAENSDPQRLRPLQPELRALVDARDLRAGLPLGKTRRKNGHRLPARTNRSRSDRQSPRCSRCLERSRFRAPRQAKITSPQRPGSGQRYRLKGSIYEEHFTRTNWLEQKLEAENSQNRRSDWRELSGTGREPSNELENFRQKSCERIRHSEENIRPSYENFSRPVSAFVSDGLNTIKSRYPVPDLSLSNGAFESTTALLEEQKRVNERLIRGRWNLHGDRVEHLSEYLDRVLGDDRLAVVARERFERDDRLPDGTSGRTRQPNRPTANDQDQSRIEIYGIRLYQSSRGFSWSCRGDKTLKPGWICQQKALPTN